MKKPKTIYEYDPYTRKLKRHKILSECIPVPVEGGRWRCRTHDHDFYGWDTLNAAKAAEIDRAISDNAKHSAELLRQAIREVKDE